MMNSEKVTTEQMAGHTLYLAKKHVLDECGKRAWQGVVACLPSEDQSLVSGIILSKKRYPGRVCQRLLAAIDGELGRDALIANARYQANRQLNGFYGIVAKLVSVDTVLGRTGPMWRRNWSGGARNVLAGGAKGLRVGAH